MTIRKNILVSWLSHVVTVLVGFFMMPHILRTIGESPYGAWLLINAIAGYSGIVYSGFGTTICRFVAEHSARKEWKELNVLVSSIQAVYLVTASIIFALTAVLAWQAPALAHWDGVPLAEVRLAILIVGLTIGVSMVSSVYGAVLIGIQRMDYYRGIEAGMGLLRMGLTIWFLHNRQGLVTLALIYLAVTAVDQGLSAFLAYRQVPTLRVAPWRGSWRVVKGCFNDSLLTALAHVAEYLINLTDTVVIGMVISPAAVMPYQIGQRITQMIRVPIVHIGEAVLPKAGELHARQSRAELGDLVARAMGLALFLSAGFMIGCVYFGDLLIQTWIGPGYPVSVIILSLLMLAQMVSLPLTVARKAMLGIGQIRQQAVIDFAEALCNLILSLIFIHWWGIVGVAVGTVLPMVVIELGFLLPIAMRHLLLTRQMIMHVVVGRQIPALLALVLFCEAASPHLPARGWIPLLAVTAGGGAILLGVRWLTELLIQRPATAQLTTRVEPA